MEHKPITSRSADKRVSHCGIAAFGGKNRFNVKCRNLRLSNILGGAVWQGEVVGCGQAQDVQGNGHDEDAGATEAGGLCCQRVFVQKCQAWNYHSCIVAWIFFWGQQSVGAFLLMFSISGLDKIDDLVLSLHCLTNLSHISSYLNILLFSLISFLPSSLTF